MFLSSYFSDERGSEIEIGGKYQNAGLIMGGYKARLGVVPLAIVAAMLLSVGWCGHASAYSQVGSTFGAAGGGMDGSPHYSISAVGQGQPIGILIAPSSRTNFTGFLYPAEWAANTNNYPPVLLAIGSPKVVLAGNVLGFTVWANDPNGTLPVLSATPLPPGATFQSSQSGTNRTAAFSWTPNGGQLGVYPILFSASDGEYSVDETVVLYVGVSGEGTNNVNGLPDSLVGYSPITNLLISSSGNATLQWAAVSGITYKIYYSNQPVKSNMTWTLMTSITATESADQVVDGAFNGSPGRTYTIAFGNEAPGVNGAWRGNRSTVPTQRFSLAGPGVESDRNFGGVMGRNLAAKLTGDASGQGDRIHVLQPNGAWRILWLDEAAKWREASDNSYSSYVLPAGLGFGVERPSLSQTMIEIPGRVGNWFTNTVVIHTGWNLISLSEGRELSLSDVFKPGDPIGGGWLDAADQIHLLESDGRWTTLMFVNGWGPPYDNQWINVNTFQIYNNKLMPGQAYYYFRQGGNLNVEF